MTPSVVGWRCWPSCGRGSGPPLRTPTVAVHDSPKPPATRVSLTREALERSREVWFVVSGADKADAVRRGIEGAPFDEAPSANVHGEERTLWLVDEEAAAGLGG